MIDLSNKMIKTVSAILTNLCNIIQKMKIIKTSKKIAAATLVLNIIMTFNTQSFTTITNNNNSNKFNKEFLYSKFNNNKSLNLNNTKVSA